MLIYDYFNSFKGCFHSTLDTYSFVIPKMLVIKMVIILKMFLKLIFCQKYFNKYCQNTNSQISPALLRIEPSRHAIARSETTISERCKNTEQAFWIQLPESYPVGPGLTLLSVQWVCCIQLLSVANYVLCTCCLGLPATDVKNTKNTIPIKPQIHSTKTVYTFQ